MEFWKDLPTIIYQGNLEDSIIELEVDGEVQKLPEERTGKEDIVFVGRMGGTTYLIFGILAQYEYIKPGESQSGVGFTRLKIEGTIVSVS